MLRMSWQFNTASMWQSVENPVYTEEVLSAVENEIKKITWYQRGEFSNCVISFSGFYDWQHHFTKNERFLNEFDGTTLLVKWGSRPQKTQKTKMSTYPASLLCAKRVGKKYNIIIHRLGGIMIVWSCHVSSDVSVTWLIALNITSIILCFILQTFAILWYTLSYYQIDYTVESTPLENSLNRTEH